MNAFLNLQDFHEYQISCVNPCASELRINCSCQALSTIAPIRNYNYVLYIHTSPSMALGCGWIVTAFQWSGSAVH